MERYTLRMIFECPHGKNHQMAIDVSPCVARELERIAPLSEYMPGSVSFDDAVDILKTRELRKDMFIKEAMRLGEKLAVSMEDKEGWHGEERKERTLSKGETP